MPGPVPPTGRPLLGGLYQRVSNDPRGESVSPAQQEKENRAWCAANSIEVAWSITDSGLSASRYARKARPGYEQVERNLAGEAPVDILIAWEASRYQRDLEVHVELRKLCCDPVAGRNVLLAYKGRIYDFTRPDDRFATGLDALLAERESEETRERVLRASRARAADGRAHGRITYGYRSLHDPHTGAVLGREPDPKTAPIVREMHARALDGESLHELTRDLIRRGVPSPGLVRKQRRGEDPATARRWTRHDLRRILINPANAGLRVHRGQEVGRADWEPLVSEEDHRGLTALVRQGGRVTNIDWRPKYLLSGIIRCGVCHAPCRRVMNRASASYACDATKGGRRCVSRLQEPIDQLVTETVLAIVARPEFRAAFQRVQTEPSGPDPREELRVLEERLRAFDEAAEAGELSAAAFGRMEARLMPRIEAARERTVSVRLPGPIRQLVVAHDPAEVWNGWSGTQGLIYRRQVIRYLLDVEILPSLVRHGMHGFDPSRIAVTPRWSTPP